MLVSYDILKFRFQACFLSCLHRDTEFAHSCAMKCELESGCGPENWFQVLLKLVFFLPLHVVWKHCMLNNVIGSTCYFTLLPVFKFCDMACNINKYFQIYRKQSKDDVNVHHFPKLYETGKNWSRVWKKFQANCNYEPRPKSSMKCLKTAL